MHKYLKCRSVSIQAEDEYRKEGRWVDILDKFLARLFATVAIWVRIQTSFKIQKMAT
jgi:hypothetical protein